ncbi:hypothetical protein BBF96_03605 [Anoxybacter fermentans]|uniref:Tail specific protease domain-containing protein n=1 Tax=Anoxybacter fermentans TaxID=1323375 RepID=A0A3Q9HPI5_9FIRM|nr:S41 family peptidase [Anoxybacter fermentans]AZR72548.1 hypothetical protein BBF96_03605 [Anoxybacter fermentans]
MNIKLLLNILVLSFLVILVLFYSNLGEASSKLVWKEYSNQYFKIKYPAEWNKAEAGNRVGFAPINGSIYFGFDIDVVTTEDVSSFEKFQNRFKNQIKKLHSSASEIEVEEISIDGQPAYKILATNSLYQIKGFIISVYKNKTAFDLTFTGTEEEYFNYYNVFEEMINSIKFYNFKVEEEEIKLVKGRKLTSKEAIEDALYLFEKLEEIHPNLYKYYSKQEAYVYFNQIKEEISKKDEISKLELYKLLAPYVASFKDGHTELSIYNEYNSYLEQGGKIFPLKVVIKGDKLFVGEDFAESDISVATEILSINGVSSSEILETMKKNISYDLEGFRIKRLEDDFPMWLWANYGKKDFFAVKFKIKSGEVKSVFLKGIKDIKKKENDFSLSYPDEGVALLKINNFYSERGEKFKTFVDKSFKEIKSKKCKNLIIDLRNNGGGTSILVSYLYEYITNKPYCTVKETRYKLSDYVLEHGEYFKLSQVAKLGNKRVLVEKPELKKPNKNQYKFNGCIYVLIGKGTYSAAVNFAAMVKDFITGILVGEETGGYASYYGNSVDIELPYSGLTLKVATTQNIRPAGYDNGKGVLPDVKVDVDPLMLVQGKDQVLETVLQMIKNKEINQ